MDLSIRMKAVASMVTPGLSLVDIGTDHAYIPVYLVQKGICPKALAMDVGQGPLMHAEANIRKYLLTDKISVRISDGFHAFNPGEAQTAVIAGMGGMLMARILREGEANWGDLQELILQPQSDIDQVKIFLKEHGWLIVDENMVIDHDKYYIMMKAVRGMEGDYTEEEWTYGRHLIRQKHPVLLSYLQKEERHLSRILGQLSEKDTERNRSRAEEVRKELDLLKKTLQLMQI